MIAISQTRRLAGTPLLTKQGAAELIRCAFVAGKQYKVDPLVTLGVMARETGFSPPKSSSLIGPMQIAWRAHWPNQETDTKKALKEQFHVPNRDTFKKWVSEIRNNVHYGTWYLSLMIKDAKGIKAGLEKYNSTKLRKDYARDILSNWMKQLEAAYKKDNRALGPFLTLTRE